MTSFGQYFSCTRSWSQGGCRTRPSIRWQDRNNMDEGPCLRGTHNSIFSGIWAIRTIRYIQNMRFECQFFNNPLVYRVLCLFVSPIITISYFKRLVTFIFSPFCEIFWFLSFNIESADWSTMEVWSNQIHLSLFENLICQGHLYHQSLFLTCMVCTMNNKWFEKWIWIISSIEASHITTPAALISLASLAPD